MDYVDVCIKMDQQFSDMLIFGHVDCPSKKSKCKIFFISWPLKICGHEVVCDLKWFLVYMYIFKSEMYIHKRKSFK